jgi:hypothetical protein
MIEQQPHKISKAEFHNLKNILTLFETYLDTFEVTKDAKKAEYMMEMLAQSYQIADLESTIQDIEPFLSQYLSPYLTSLDLEKKNFHFLDQEVQKKIDHSNRKK